jgi:hypothetical protein
VTNQKTWLSRIRSFHRRFFSPRRELAHAELKQLTDVDFNRIVALVVTLIRQFLGGM